MGVQLRHWLSGIFKKALMGKSKKAAKPFQFPILETLETRLTPAAPVLLSMNRAAGTTASISADFTATFDQSVTGVDAGDFSILATGTVSSSPSVTVTPVSGSVFTISVTGITGAGTLGIKLEENGSIKNGGNEVLSGAGLVFASPVNPMSTFVTDAPYAMARGDVNGDGVLDLATVNHRGGGRVNILLGNADGTFANALSVVTGSYPNAVALADLNGDGKLDIVNTNLYGSAGAQLSVLLGNGDGTFKAQTLYEAGRKPNGVSLGDLDGDGFADIAVSNRYGSNLSGTSPDIGVLFNNGDGTFSPVEVLPTSNYSISNMKMADVNGDGDLDLVHFAGGNVNLHLGNGDGTFKAFSSFSPNGTASAMNFGDVNGDSKLDLIASGSSEVNIFLGNGNGTFASGVSFTTGSGSNSIALGDVNGDGKMDLATGNYDSGTVSVLLGNGNGTFGATLNLLTGVGPKSVQLYDFNGDSKLDISTANRGSGNVSVIFGNGDGTFKALQPIPTGTNPKAIDKTDVNGDGFLDVVTANRNGSNVSVLLGNADGSFKNQVTFGTGSRPEGVKFGDFNKDGKADIATANWNGSNVSVLLGNGDGTFKSQVNFSTGYSTRSISTGDFDGDGNPDLVTASHYGGYVSVLLGNGDGTFKAQATFAGNSHPASVAVADLNGDSVLDFALGDQNYNTSIAVLIGNGDGTFKNKTTFLSDHYPRQVVAADVNGDGKMDLVTNSSGARVSVLLGNGDGTFQAKTTFQVSDRPWAVRVGDLNGDGLLDISTSNYNNTVSVLLGNGDGKFNPHKSFGVVPSPQSFAQADFNYDGKVDILVAGYDGSSLTLYSNQGAGSIATSQTYTIVSDTTPPTVVITSNVSALKAGETATITFTLSESSTMNFDSGKVTIPGGTLSSLTGSGMVYTATFTPTVDSIAPGLINVAGGVFTDAAGNDNTPATQLTLAVDTLAPTVVITSNVSALKAGETATITFTLSENAANFDSSDVIASGGLLSNFAGSSSVYTATFTPTVDSVAPGLINVAGGVFTDAAGNDNTLAMQLTLYVDTVAPTVVLTTSATSLRANETANITFTFSEVPVGFSNSLVTVTGGTLGTIDGKGLVYSAVFTPQVNSIANGTITVGIGYTDMIGNPGLAGSLTPPITVNTVQQTLVVSTPGMDPSGTSVRASTQVTLLDPVTGQETGTITPFPGFNGEVNVATGDTDGDGTAETIIAAGPGGGPAVLVVNSNTGQVMDSFFAYSPTFTGGVFLTVRDVNHDGNLDIVTGAGPGGGPHVKVFDGGTLSTLMEFFAYDTSFRGGVSVGSADINNDGNLDIVTGAGPGGGPHVKVFDGATGNLLSQWFAYDPSFRGGVYVAIGDLGNDGSFEVITGSGSGGAPVVAIWNAQDGSLISRFMAYAPEFRGGVRVGIVDADLDGNLDIVTGAGPGGGPHIKVFSYPDLDLLASYFNGDPSNREGVFVS